MALLDKEEAGALPLGRDVLIGLLITGFAYALLLGHRSDYLGHYLAGVGGTMLLLVVPAALFRGRLGWVALVPTVIAIAIGARTEATIFRLAVFDPVDFLNQSLGACLAGSLVVGRKGSFPMAAILVLAGGVSLFLGFHFAFA